MYLETRDRARPVNPPSMHARANIPPQISAGHCVMAEDGTAAGDSYVIRARFFECLAIGSLRMGWSLGDLSHLEFWT